jgi:hypothetical protein
MGMFGDKLNKDFGTDNCLWYCLDNTCDSVYNTDNLKELDDDNKIIWGRIHKGSKRLVPICATHGRFLMFMEDTVTPKEVTLM